MPFSQGQWEGMEEYKDMLPILEPTLIGKEDISDRIDGEKRFNLVACVQGTQGAGPEKGLSLGSTSMGAGVA